MRTGDCRGITWQQYTEYLYRRNHQQTNLYAICNKTTFWQSKREILFTKVCHLTASNQNNKLWYYYTWHVLDISLNTTITGKFYFLEKGYFLHELKFFSDHKYQVAVSCIDLKRSLIYIHLKKWWIFCCHNLNLLAQSDVDPTTQH